MSSIDIETMVKAPVTKWLVSGLRLTSEGSQVYKRVVAPGAEIGSAESYKLIRTINGVDYVDTMAGNWPLADEHGIV